MRNSKAVTVVHPDWRIRIALRTLLEAHGCTVSTDYSCSDLLTGPSDVRPDLILVDRPLLDHEGIDILSRLGARWTDTEIVFLPEGLTAECGISAVASPLLQIVDRLLEMRTTRDILSV
jgi:FixJ family two-component response regulator